MRRISILFLLSVSVLMLSAQSRLNDLNVQTVMNHRAQPIERMLMQSKSPQQYLVARSSNDGYESKSFYYDYREHVVAVFNSEGAEQIVDSIGYDANNNVIQVRSYQLLNGTWKYVAYINYGYDADNHLIERTNFNSFGTDDFEQGGVYDYNYVNGRLVSHEGYFGDHQTLFETCDYGYDAQGRLVCQTYLQGYGSLDSSMKVVYTYDAQGRPAMNYTYGYDYGWYLFETEEFVYDAAGNCVDHSLRDGNGDYTERHLYEYDLSVPADAVSMPYYIPEMSDPEAFDDANKRLWEHWYTLDDNFVLQYICDYEYVYDANPLSVESYAETECVAYPNPTQDEVIIRNDACAMSAVVVFDSYGRYCLSETVNGNVARINLAEFPAGIYILKIAYADGLTECCKILKSN